MNINTIVKTSAAVVLITLAGCATQADLEAARAVADRAVQDAAAAKSAADVALAAAHEASAGAISAKSVADRAQQEAQAGTACCNANSEKMDRMFKQLASK